MGAIARLEKSIDKSFHESSVMDFLLKIIVLAIILFFIFYIVIYRAIITGNPIRIIYFLGFISFIELVNFIYRRYEPSRK